MTTILQNQESAETTELDLLGREQFVERMLSITEALSANRKNACYAINGRWGTGKTYVLSMFEDRVKTIKISEDDFGEKYLVFKYNCWEYDYYDEPLVAITAAMLDNIANNPSILDPKIRSEVFDALKATGNGLLKATAKIAEKRTGVPSSATESVIMSIINAVTGQTRGKYDAYSSFNKYLKQLKEKITDLAIEQTVIILVDELDRCLPEYTIKVLERLHHLFYGIDNVQVILSIDKIQLEQTIQTIYGKDTDVGKYLEKFVDFSLCLDIGSIQKNFNSNFQQYVAKFTSPSTHNEEIEEFKLFILKGIDIRTCIAIVEKCNLAHSILCDDKELDSRFLCLELFLSVLNYANIRPSYVKQKFTITELFDAKTVYGRTSEKSVPEGLTILSQKYSQNSTPDGLYHLFNKDDYYLDEIQAGCFLGILLCAYRMLLGFEDRWILKQDDPVDKDYILKYGDYGKQFWEVLQALK